MLDWVGGGGAGEQRAGGVRQGRSGFAEGVRRGGKEKNCSRRRAAVGFVASASAVLLVAPLVFPCGRRLSSRLVFKRSRGLLQVYTVNNT